MSEPIKLGRLDSGPLTPAFKESIERAISAAVPEGKKGVVIAVADQDGVRFGTAWRVGDTFQLAADVEKTWGGPVSGEVALIATF